MWPCASSLQPKFHWHSGGNKIADLSRLQKDIQKKADLARFFFFCATESESACWSHGLTCEQGWSESSLLFLRRGADEICSDCLCEGFVVVVVVVSTIFTTGIQSRWRRVSVEGLDRRDYCTVLLHFAENVELLRSVYLADGLKVRHTWVCW